MILDLSPATASHYLHSFSFMGICHSSIYITLHLGFATFRFVHIFHLLIHFSIFKWICLLGFLFGEENSYILGIVLDFRNIFLICCNIVWIPNLILAGIMENFDELLMLGFFVYTVFDQVQQLLKQESN